MNQLVNLTRQSQSDIIKNCIANGQVLKEKRISNNRKFNLTDFYYILCRSMKSSLIREWHLQSFKAICLLSGVILLSILFPGDIGSDPSCPIDLINDANLSEITDEIYDVINGKRSKGEMNICYLILLFFIFSLIYNTCIAFVFPDEIKVRKLKL